MTTETEKPVIRVAVIGAGASGLVQTQQLLEAWSREAVKTKLEVVVFEAREDVGGVWLSEGGPKQAERTSLPGENDKVDDVFSYPTASRISSPMYEGLRTNIPAPIMAFRGFEFPEKTSLFPDRAAVLKYLQSYAKAYDLLPYIRFNTCVERVYLTPTNCGSDNRRWTVEFVSGNSKTSEGFDYISVSNGHYSDGWIPNTPGLSSFPGQIIHSRFYRRACDHAGQTVLVVGSFASGGDISRLLASHNIDKYDPSGQPLSRSLTPDQKLDDSSPLKAATGESFIKVYVSSSGATSHSASPDGPCAPYIHNLPLISHLSPPSPTNPKGIIHFEDGQQLSGVDTIIYATGYNFAYPFFKRADKPWGEIGLVDGVIRSGERKGGEEWEEGGVKGLGMKKLDELLLFLEGDRSIAFPALAYQVVPFPLAQVQARLTSLLWANLLPSFPQHPNLPENPSNPYSKQSTSEPFTNDSKIPTLSAPQPDVTVTASATPPTTTTVTKVPSSSSQSTAPLDPSTRKTLTARQKLLFGTPYEWTYSEYLMSLMSEADDGKEAEVEEHWKKIEPWRREMRDRKDLRKKTLGY
ncbi:monooxygenase [Cryptococcus neoformans Bt15]|nr:monooxygenase [Cryptococcus neoformans var. grubii Bt15]